MNRRVFKTFYRSSRRAGCRFIDAGTPAIDPGLLTSLRNKTTQPPLTTLTGSVLGQHALRDINTPDLGYHYDPLDYCLGGQFISGTLTLTGGTAIGIYGAFGFQGGTLISIGSPVSYNHLVRYCSVQEQPVAWGGTPIANTLLAASLTPVIRFHFTDVSLGGGGPFCSVSAPSSMEIMDCSLLAAQVTVTGGYGAYGTVLGFTNNIFERGGFTLLSCSGNPYYANFCNNLFLNGNLGLANACGGSILPNFAVRNNLFVNGSFTYGTYSGYTPQIVNNGYNNTTLTDPGAAYQVITNLDFKVGPLGIYYYPPSGGNLSQLIDAGSMTVAAAGLAGYTTRTNQTTDTGTVDIGFHYAVNNVGFVPPVAYGNSFQVCQNSTNLISFSGWSSNSSSLFFTVLSNPSNGTLTNTGAAGSAGYAYTPTTGFCGADSFWFKVNDGFLDSSSAAINFTVGYKPDASFFAVQTCSNTPVTIDQQTSDVCGGAMTAVVLNHPTHGGLTNWVYTPAPGYVGSDSIVYEYVNCLTNSDPQTISITVNGTPSASVQALPSLITKPTSAGASASTGQFRVGLSTAPCANLSLYYQISGTATNGVDYVATNTATGGQVTSGLNSLTIASGLLNDTIEITPLLTPGDPFDKTVTLSLVVGSGYLVDSYGTTDTIMIQGDSAYLFQVVTNVNSPIGIDYSPALQSLIVSVNYNLAGRSNNFVSISTNAPTGDLQVINWSAVHDRGDEVKLATVKQDVAGFTNGDVFFASGAGIGWVSADGSAANQNWCVLTNASVPYALPLRGGLYVDQSGVFSNQLIAVTSESSIAMSDKGVWRVDSNAQPTLIATINTFHLEGVVTLPNDTNQWGPWAGEIITGDEDAPPNGIIYTIASNGIVKPYDTTAMIAGGIQPEDFDIIPTNQDLYCVGYLSYYPASPILKVSKTFWNNYVGDLLIAEAGERAAPAKLFIVHWDAATTNFITHRISFVNPEDVTDSHLEHVTFAPINLPSY